MFCSENLKSYANSKNFYGFSRAVAGSNYEYFYCIEPATIANKQQVTLIDMKLARQTIKLESHLKTPVKTPCKTKVADFYHKLTMELMRNFTEVLLCFMCLLAYILQPNKAFAWQEFLTKFCCFDASALEWLEFNPHKAQLLLTHFRCLLTFWHQSPFNFLLFKSFPSGGQGFLSKRQST